MNTNKNKEALKRLEQGRGAQIEKLFWIAASLENGDLQELLEEMEEEGYLEECFPELYKSLIPDGEIVQVLVDFDKLGLVAQIHIPIPHNFNYDNYQKIFSKHT